MSNLFKTMALSQYDETDHIYHDMHTVVLNTESISSMEEFCPNDPDYAGRVLVKVTMNNGTVYITDDDIDEMKKDIEESEMINNGVCENIDAITSLPPVAL